MIEIAIPADRIAGDPVRAEDVEPLFDAGLFDGGPHPRRLGRPETSCFSLGRCGLPLPAATSSLFTTI
jgi:formate dehydrogenase iron-sulfur subunit